VFAPLVTAAVLVPMIVISSLGHLCLRTLAIWAIAATILCAGLAIYDIFRDPLVLLASAPVPRVLPSWVMSWSLAAILFIVHIQPGPACEEPMGDRTRSAAAANDAGPAHDPHYGHLPERRDLAGKLCAAGLE
jgi:hypothetical protein